MIRLNVFLRLKDMNNKDALRAVATELVEKSRGDEGCIAYDFFESATIGNHMMICETWAGEKELDAHSASEHFTTLVPQMEALAEMKLERFDF